MDLLALIHQELRRVQDEYDQKAKQKSDNREASIALVKFIGDTINALAPGEIVATYIGSSTNPSHPQYPNVAISATLAKTQQVLTCWVIDTGGGSPAPTLTQGEIEQCVLEALQRVNRK